MVENPELAYTVENLKLIAIQDGTNTRVELRWDDEDGPIIAHGSARRAKGDRRNSRYGVALAAQRAAMNLYAMYAREAERLQRG